MDKARIGGPEAFYSLSEHSGGDSVGARIKLMREHRGLTQKALALELGDVSRVTVAFWETNRGGESKHLPRLAKVLGVPVEFFVDGLVEYDVKDNLSLDEKALVDLYRGCEVSQRLTILRTASRLRRACMSKSS
jgi:transcriptional regulator with XRE-family HTH domain